MATSGNELTRLGASISAVGIKLTITPKSETEIVIPDLSVVKIGIASKVRGLITKDQITS